MNDSGGYECRVRLPDGTLDEAVISPAEAAALVDLEDHEAGTVSPVDTERRRLLVESARIRLVRIYDWRFAVEDKGVEECSE